MRSIHRKKCRIAIIEPVGGHGGMDYYDYGLAHGLGMNGIEVGYHTCSDTIERKYINVYTYKTFRNVWTSNKYRKLIQLVQGYFKSLRQEKHFHSGIVHYHFFQLGLVNLIVLMMTKAFSIQVVVTVHDVQPFHKKSYRLIENICYQLIDAVIIHNMSSYNELNSRVDCLPIVKIVPHGNYFPFYDKLPLPAKSDTLNLLFFGQIKYVKGLEILLEALSIVVKKNRNVHLVVAGRPWQTNKNKYIELINELNLSNNVDTNFEYIEDHEVFKYYEKADIVVLPYRKIYQSGVLLLTMSLGRAAIVSNLPAFTEIIEHNVNGYLFNTEDAEDLARCILKISMDRNIEVSKRARSSISRAYNWKTIGWTTKALYDSIT